MSKRLASSDIYVEEIVKSGLYQVREDGSVWSKVCRSGHIRDVFRRVDYVESTGYRRVCYKRRNITAHRIVYRALKGELDARLVVNHIDGDKANNHPSNLELVSTAANNVHAQRLHGGFGRTKQSAYHLRAALIRALTGLGASRGEVARALGLSKSFVSQVCSSQVFPESDPNACDWKRIRDLVLKLTR